MRRRAQQIPTHSDQEVSFVVPGVPESFDVLEITPVGMKKLRTRRVTGGVALVLERCDQTALVLLTPDVSVVNAMTRRLNGVAAEAAELLRKSANAQYEVVEGMTRELPVLSHDAAITADHLKRRANRWTKRNARRKPPTEPPFTPNRKSPSRISACYAARAGNAPRKA
ncbi:MAG: hypothetical protein QM811_12540 [Pirellulales bacterium]